MAFRNVFGGQLTALLPVFFGLGAIGLARNPHGIVEQTREGVADLRARLTSSRRSSGGDGAMPVPDQRGPVGDDALVTFLRSATYHRIGCVLTTGKDGKVVTPAAMRRLAPCAICAPTAPGAGAPRRREPLRARGGDLPNGAFSRRARSRAFRG